jgi:hypothetical protein
MMTLAMHLSLAGDNLRDVLTGFLPSVGQAVAAFPARTVSIIDQELHTNRFAIAKVWFERHFSLTIEKTAPDTLLVFFDDVTDFLIKADALRQRE